MFNFVNSSNTQKSSYVKVDKANLQKTNVPFNLVNTKKIILVVTMELKLETKFLQLLKK